MGLLTHTGCGIVSDPASNHRWSDALVFFQLLAGKFRVLVPSCATAAILGSEENRD